MLGVLLAYAAGSALGVDAASLGLVLVAGMLAGANRSLRAESTTAAATALVVLLTADAEADHRVQQHRGVAGVAPPAPSPSARVPPSRP